MKHKKLFLTILVIGSSFVLQAAGEKVEVPSYAQKSQDARYMRLRDVKFTRPYNEMEESMKSDWKPSIDQLRKFHDKIDSIAGQSDTPDGYDKADLDDFQFFEDDRKAYFEDKAKRKEKANPYHAKDFEDFVNQGSPDFYTFTQEQKEKIEGIYKSVIEKGYDDKVENLMLAITSAKKEKHIVMVKVVALYALELLCAVGIFDFMVYCANLILHEQKLTKLQKARIKREKLDYKVLYWVNKLESMKEQFNLDTQVQYTMLLQSYIDEIKQISNLEQVSEDRLLKFLSILRGLKRESEVSFQRMKQESVEQGAQADSEDQDAVEQIMQESRELYEQLFSAFQTKKGKVKKKDMKLSTSSFIT